MLNIVSCNADSNCLKIYKEYSIVRAVNVIRLFVTDRADAPAGHTLLIEPEGVKNVLGFLTGEEKELYMNFGKNRLVSLTKIPKTKLVFRFNFVNEAYRFELGAGLVNSFYDMLKSYKPKNDFLEHNPEDAYNEIEREMFNQ